jgi:hypothetical protein
LRSNVFVAVPLHHALHDLAFALAQIDAEQRGGSGRPAPK